jgi:predicted nucleotidyltransferase
MKLTTFLQQSDARKVFGQRELRIINKQLKGINLTQSEKNRLSRDIRPKFRFISECARFSDDFGLSKGFETEQAIEEAKELILGYPDVRKIVVYGSYIDRSMTLRSDIDIAVDLGKTDMKRATRFRQEILGKLEGIDVQVYDQLPTKIRRAVDKGRVIYENRGEDKGDRAISNRTRGHSPT